MATSTTIRGQGARGALAGTRRAVAGVRKWSRRRLMVNPAYQLRTLLPIGVLIFAYGILLGGLVFYPLHSEVSAEPDPVIRVLLSELLLTLHLRMWPLLAFAGLVAVLFALLRSHRVAGPLYRLDKVLRGMARGQVHHVRFREGDEFREFELLANQLAQKMKLLATRNRDTFETVQFRTRNLSARLRKEDLSKQEVQEALEAILEQLGKTA